MPTKRTAKPPDKPKRGRPPGRSRVQQSLNLPPDLWAWLDGQVRPGETRNDAAQRLLTKLRACLSRSSDEPR